MQAGNSVTVLNTPRYIEFGTLRDCLYDMLLFSGSHLCVQILSINVTMPTEDAECRAFRNTRRLFLESCEMV